MYPTCIFCLESTHPPTVEHIIPHSLGNIHFVLPKGKICLRCNQLFARAENSILSSELFQKLKTKEHLNLNDTSDLLKQLDKRSLKIFIGKIAFESLHHSRYKTWQLIDFMSFRQYVFQNKEMKFYWPPESLIKWRKVPGRMDSFRLGLIGWKLEYGRKAEYILCQIQFRNLSLKASFKMVGNQDKRS